MPEPARIADYALIGDCRSAALVGRHGGLDWLCWPRFDSPAVFAALLDGSRGGTWSIRPSTDAHEVNRRYRPGTPVLETTFTTEEGVLVVSDFMPVADERQKSRELWPEHQVLRRVECVRGSVEVEARFAPRPDFARRRFRTSDRGPSGLLIELGADVLAYRTDLAHDVDPCGALGRTRLQAGDVRWASLTFTSRGPAYLAPLGESAERRLRQTLEWWGGWSHRIGPTGDYHDIVVRSAITLKLLTYAPSGAVVAAPTTSLPERMGGERNWDYRYCWLRDAAMTVQAFYALGCREEGEAFASWILHATRLTWPEVRVLYDVHGNPPPAEREVDGLAGFGGSRPVRIGNGARDQFQLDVYGEVVGAVAEYVRRGGTLDRSSRKLLRGIAKTVCRRWREPDHGIWEARAEPRQHTYSKVRCWSALDTLLSLDRDGALGLPRERMQSERDALAAAIEENGWNPRTGSYASTFDGDDVDASLLLLAESGYLDAATSDRFAGTVRAVEARLAEGPYVYRYRADDGLRGSEGTFGICAFWRVLALLGLGEREQARRHFEALLARANDVGLFAEEMAPGTGEALGNFPQAFTHVGVIRAALALEGREAGEDTQ